jgi:hypothetical protein
MKCSGSLRGAYERLYEGEKVGFARHNFARTDADVNSQLQLIPIVGERILVRLATNFEEDYRVVEEQPKAAVSV